MRSGKVKKKVCLVLNESGPGENGHLASLDGLSGLASLCETFNVDILVSSWPSLPAGAKKNITRQCRSLGANVCFVDPTRYAEIQPETAQRASSLAVFRHLSEEGDYDVVHFLGEPWLAFYTLCARNQGTAFSDSVIVLQPDRLVSWRFRARDGLPCDPADLILEHMEQGAIARADYLVLPSAYSLDWMRGRGWALPPEDRCRVILPAAAPGGGGGDTLGGVLPDSGRLSGIEELIFVAHDIGPSDSGVMIGALNRLAPRLVADGIRVSVLTRFHTDECFHSGTDLIEGAEGWDFPLAIFPTEFDTALNARLSAAPNAVAILADELPFSARSITPAVARGVPVVMSRQGGANEVLEPAQRAKLTCEMTAKALANLLASALDNGLPRPIISAPVLGGDQAIISLYEGATGRDPLSGSTCTDLPLVTVCITHYQRIGKLQQALRSVLAQTYPKIEILVVDDGSPDDEVQAELDRLEPELHRHGGRLIRRPNGYLGAARNSGAAAAKGSYVCFLDDDDLMLPDMVQTLVTAALNTGAEIVSGLQMPMPTSRRGEALADPVAFPGKMEFFPLGGPLALTLKYYSLANATSLILLSAFREIGGYTELRDVGGEDHEFYTRALQNGMRIEISPHLAYLYETGVPSMWGNSSHLKHMARIADSVELDHRAELWRDMFLLTAGEQARHITALKQKRRLEESSHRNTLQSLYGSTDLQTQLQQLSAYAHQLGRNGLANALHATLIARKNRSEHKHAVPEPVANRGGAKSSVSLQPTTESVGLPEGLQGLLHDLTTDSNSPIFVQNARLNEIRDLARRGMSKSACRSLLAELGRVEEVGQDHSLFSEFLFELALRGEDWPMAMKLVDAAAETDDAAYLRLYPDVARAVEQRAFKDGLQHYVKWGRKEGRYGYALMTSLSRVATAITGQDIQPDRLRKTLRQLSSRDPHGNESTAS